ncbi:MAG TPA: hypothetical protein VFJ90_13565 [Candidatus Didemnitutus sp.]|nr:hypothetical protein [Candidatus Didemnitutus sp.]
MPGADDYEPVLSGQASSFLVGLRRTQQAEVVGLIFQLSRHPHQLGDYATRDGTGRAVQHLAVGEWHFSFWADHAVRELRVTEIAEL